MAEGKLEHDEQGRPSSLADLRITAMRDASGDEPSGKGDIDAEGVSLRAGQVIVSFERNHRVDIYPDPALSRQAIPLAGYSDPKGELRGNGSLETVVVAPPDGPLKGAALTIAERSVDRQGRLYAAILEGPLKGQFKSSAMSRGMLPMARFSAGGDLLLLERRFSFIGGVGMRIRRIPADSISRVPSLMGRCFSKLIRTIRSTIWKGWMWSQARMAVRTDPRLG